MSRTVVLTRPHTEGLQWQQLLHAHGVQAAVLPLIEIAPHQDPATLQALQALASAVSHYRALMLVSPNAVRALLATPGMQSALAAAMHAGHTRLWAPGPGTAQLLREAGLPAHAIDSPAADAAQFDSEALWAVVGHTVQAHDRIVVVRGASAQATRSAQGSGRDWLAQQLRSRGAQVEFIGVYTRQCPAPHPELLARLGAHRAAQDWWLFSSSEAVTHLQRLLPECRWDHQRALTTHPRIAAAAQQAGFGVVKECKPDVKALIASIESAP